MFDSSWRPVQQFIVSLIDYKYIPYKFRQKMREIQHLLIAIKCLSKKFYKLYFMHDGVLCVDTLTNKILWTLDYTSPNVVVSHLEEIKRFWYYEKSKSFIGNLIETNDYLTLKKSYYDTQKRINH